MKMTDTRQWIPDGEGTYFIEADRGGDISPTLVRRHYTPEEARTIALTILEAVDYAEGKKQ